MSIVCHKKVGQNDQNIVISTKQHEKYDQKGLPASLAQESVRMQTALYYQSFLKFIVPSCQMSRS